MVRQRWSRWCVVTGMVLALIVLAGCGSSIAGTTSSGSNSTGSNRSTNSSGGQNAYGPAATASTGQSSTPGPQYLIKALTVSMLFSDTRKVATDLQTWIASTDPQSTSAGMDYQQIDTNDYRITMTFSIAAGAYPRVLSYLAGYAQTHGGHMEGLHETVQDVSNDYVDSQSRLKNLRTEQQRLLALLSQTTNLNDTLTIEQRLTDVEGQIEQIEGHLNALNGQTTFYDVTIALDPVATGKPTTTPISNASWNPGQTIHDAFTTALGFGEGLVSLLIWLAFFAIYLIPAALLFLLVRRLLRTRAARR